MYTIYINTKYQPGSALLKLSFLGNEKIILFSIYSSISWQLDLNVSPVLANKLRKNTKKVGNILKEVVKQKAFEEEKV